MKKSDFSTRPDIFGRSNYLIREMLALVEHAEKHPQTADELSTWFTAQSALVDAALLAAQDRTEMSGPGGGDRPDDEPEPDPAP